MPVKADDRVEKSDFTARIFSELKSRLHSRFVQYEVFTFAGKAASVSLHLTNTNVTVKLPYLIEGTSKADSFNIYFRSNMVTGSLSSIITYMLTTMRREESKLSRFKKAT